MLMLLATGILVLNVIMWSAGLRITHKIIFDPYQIIFHFGLTNFIFNSVVYLTTAEHLSAAIWFKSLFYTGFILCLAELFFTMALKYAPTLGITVLLGFVTVPISYFISNFRYSEDVNVICALGGVMVFSGILLVMFL